MSKALLEPRKTKSIALAMMLNAAPLVVFGIGYLYIGKWKRFLIVEILQVLGVISTVAWKFNGTFIVGLVWVVSIIDILIQTTKYNEQALHPA